MLGLAAATLSPHILLAQTAEVWTASQARQALLEDRIRMIDVRSRAEWLETGVAEGAWPISLHEDRFPERLFAARDLAADRPVALICATGGRSGYVMRSLHKGGYEGFIDVSEGMMGSHLGSGWVASGHPIVSAPTALSALPAILT